MKGQIYTLMAIVIAIPILLFFSQIIVSLHEVKSSTVEDIVSDQLHLVERNIENDFHKGVEIAGHRALLSATNVVMTNGSFLANSSAAFIELILNGTLDGEEQFLMVNNTADDWKTNILNIVTRFTVAVDHTYSFGASSGSSVVGTYGLNITVSDPFGISRIEKTDVRKAYKFSIEGIDDPVFPMNTNGLLRRKYDFYKYGTHYFTKFTGTVATHDLTGNGTTDLEHAIKGDQILFIDTVNTSLTDYKCIVASNGTPPAGSCFVLGPPNPASNFEASLRTGVSRHVLIDNMTASAWHLPVQQGIVSGEYFLIKSGPGVFERLEGVYNSSNPQFITFANINELTALGITAPNDDTSKVAWMYFSGSSTPGKQVRGLPGWAKMDSETAAEFGLSELWGP